MFAETYTTVYLTAANTFMQLWSLCIQSALKAASSSNPPYVVLAPRLEWSPRYGSFNQRIDTTTDTALQGSRFDLDALGDKMMTNDLVEQIKTHIEKKVDPRLLAQRGSFSIPIPPGFEPTHVHACIDKLKTEPGGWHAKLLGDKLHFEHREITRQG